MCFEGKDDIDNNKIKLNFSVFFGKVIYDQRREKVSTDVIY